jgi:hypothetical protein
VKPPNVIPRGYGGECWLHWEKVNRVDLNNRTNDAVFKSDETDVCECSIRLYSVKMRVREPVGPWPTIPWTVVIVE